MPPVFVDTVAWIALLNTSDENHSRAEQAMADLRDQQAALATTEFVLLEVADALSAPAWRTKTVAFLNGLRNLPVLRIIPATPELFAEGWQLYGERPDKDWSLTDCISFAAMMDEQISEVLTSDHHFEQAGFSRLL